MNDTIDAFADACRKQYPDPQIVDLLKKVIEAGIQLYKDKTCDVFTDAGKGWLEEDRYYLTLFTSLDKIPKVVKNFAKVRPASKLFDAAEEYDLYKGIVINPYSSNLFSFEDWTLAAVLMKGRGADEFAVENPITEETIII